MVVIVCEVLSVFLCSIALLMFSIGVASSIFPNVFFIFGFGKMICSNGFQL